VKALPEITAKKEKGVSIRKIDRGIGI